MTNKDIIKDRLDVIHALETFEVKLVTRMNDQDITVHTLTAQAATVVMKDVVAPYCTNRHCNPTGQLPDAIKEINDFIKEQFAPMIAEQKEAIKKLL